MQHSRKSNTLDVVVTWAGTPVAVERLAVGAAFTVGPHGTFACDDPLLPADRFALVAHGDGVARLRGAPGMRIIVDGAPSAAQALDLAAGAFRSARVTVGPLAFEVRFAAAALPAPSRRRRDARILGASAAALSLQATLVAALLLAPAPGPDLPSLPSSGLRAVLSVPRTLHRTKVAATEEQPAPSASEAPAPRPKARAAGPRATARELATAALAALGLDKGDTGPALPGLAAGLSGLRGNGAASLGDGGLATRLVGPGGGGGGTVGLGGGRLGGDGRTPWGDTALVGKKGTSVVVTEREIRPSDGLNREEIQRVIARAMARIKHCYERELNADPTLEGKVAPTFTIGPSGEVAASTTSTTMHTPVVATCVDAVVRSLKFPQPRGGGTVLVTYPFLFARAGD